MKKNILQDSQIEKKNGFKLFFASPNKKKLRVFMAKKTYQNKNETNASY
jgi:hypothetical protein